jgi:hypothetical protein
MGDVGGLAAIVSNFSVRVSLRLTTGARSWVLQTR